jgi:hypothetical protein
LPSISRIALYYSSKLNPHLHHEIEKKRGKREREKRERERERELWFGSETFC